MPRASTLALITTIALGFAAPAGADDVGLSKGSRTLALAGGFGHSWRPIFGQTRSVITFEAFTPSMGWFVLNRVEIYGEGTLFLYNEPETAVAAGLAGLSGRYYLTKSGGWIPYVLGGSGLLWTNLDVPEIDRVFNFQLFFGIGLRQTRAKGPHLLFEFRNHHISNAGTAGKNMGVNAATVITGVEWVIPPSR